MDPLPHTDDWTEADERAFERLPQVQEIWIKAGKEISEWRKTQTDPNRYYYWGQKYSPWDSRYKPPPKMAEERLDVFRDEIRTILSEIVPFQEPLFFSLDSKLLNAALQLPHGAQAIGPDDRVCLMIYGFELRPHDTETIIGVDPRLAYLRPKAITYSMVPSTELEERFKAKANVNLAIAAEASAEVPEIAVPPFIEVKSGAHAKIEGGLAWHWQYRVLKATVVNHGTQSDFAEWKISKGGLIGQLELRTIIRVPKRARQVSLEITGGYRVKKRGIGWHRSRIAEITPTQVTGRIVLKSPKDS